MIYTENWFNKRLENFQYDNDVKAYIVGVLNKYMKSSIDDLSKQSLILEFSNAKFTGDFLKFQKIGDWILFSMSIVPEHTKENLYVYNTIGKLSYDACYRLLNKEWKLYNELANNLTEISLNVNKHIYNKLYPR